MTVKGQKPTKHENIEIEISEKQQLRHLALKIRHIPKKFSDGNGKISEQKLLNVLIDYHRGHSSD